MLFPTLEELEAAQLRKDDMARRAVSAPMEQWSPQQVPYKTFDREGAASSSDDDSDNEDHGDVKALASEAATEKVTGSSGADDDLLEIGVCEEVGFYYKGPEPTLHGDWQHKGRVTDF
jgi:hypothetical protein